MLDRAEQFRLAIEASPTGMIMVSESGQIVLVNREIERLFGYPRDELLGQSIELLVPEGKRARHPQFRTDYHAHPQTRAMGAGRDLYGRRKDGTEIPVEIGLNPLESDGGRFVLASVVDIAPRKRAEEELRRSNADLEQFAYVASHDLQEPLRMVASYTQLLAKRYRGKLDADADEFIGYAVDGATRMQQLISDLLTYSRVGTRGRTPAPTDCEAVVARVLGDLALAVEQSGGAVTHDRLPVVMGDETQLGQLFQNLISNALKFRGPDPPRVHITAQRTGNDITFAVRDNGIGIAPEHAERIFVIFQRLHTAAQYPGTGIGLAVCKKIVERHGGRIWVDSRPGRGATFSFTIPLARP